MDGHGHSLLFLTRDEVIACGGADIGLAAADIRHGFELLETGRVLQPDKTTLRTAQRGVETDTGLVNLLSACVELDDTNVYGCKALGAMPANCERGLPRATGVIVLFDDATKTPLCIMDAQVISATRTGAVSLLAARLIADADSHEVGLVGSGINMRTQLLGLAEALPSLRCARVYSRTDKRAVFAAEMGKKTGLDIRPVDTAEAAVRDCGLIVTCAANLTEPVVRADWIRERGVTIFNIGCYESEASLLARMDRIVADMWSQGKHRGVQTHAVAASTGVISEERIEDLGPILCGRVPGRRHADENIFFAPTGLGFEDVLVAWRVYRHAVGNGLGSRISLWEAQPWI